MINDHGGNLVELESLSSEMFSPLSEREASLVVGGDAIQIADTGYECTFVAWGPGWVATGDDFLKVDELWLVY